MPGTVQGSRMVEGAVSRTYQYRKVMKPLLERRRRARINGYLEELKQLIVEQVQVDSETLAKLEKADILELTVQYLKRQRCTANPKSESSLQESERSVQVHHFQIGFLQCLEEASGLLRTENKELNFLFLSAMQQLFPNRSTSYWRPWSKQ